MSSCFRFTLTVAFPGFLDIAGPDSSLKGGPEVTGKLLETDLNNFIKTSWAKITGIVFAPTINAWLQGLRQIRTAKAGFH